jgi:uncharacterized membrane protein
MTREFPDRSPSDSRIFLGRFRSNTSKKLSLVAGLAAIMTLIVGAGFAEMSSSGAPTTSETVAVRWIALAFLAVAAAAYLVGSRLERENRK